MIFDKMEHISCYYKVLPQLEQIADFVRDFKENPREVQAELDGENLKVSSSSYRTKSPEGARYEAHKQYIDVQVVVRGREQIGWAPLSDCTMVQDFEAGGDCAFYTCDKGSMGLVNEDYFMVLFPQDAHMPCIQAGDNENVTKLVFKVKVEQVEI